MLLGKFYITVILAVILVIWGGLNALFVALYTTKDYRKRRVFWELTLELDNAELRRLYGVCMVKLARFKKLHDRKYAREAEIALILATVLHEHAMFRAGQPLPTYLKNRKLHLKQAIKLSRLVE